MTWVNARAPFEQIFIFLVRRKETLVLMTIFLWPYKGKGPFSVPSIKKDNYLGQPIQQDPGANVQGRRAPGRRIPAPRAPKLGPKDRRSSGIWTRSRGTAGRGTSDPGTCLSAPSPALLRRCSPAASAACCTGTRWRSSVPLALQYASLEQLWTNESAYVSKDQAGHLGDKGNSLVWEIWLQTNIYDLLYE